jgi:hypothetical protein
MATRVPVKPKRERRTKAEMEAIVDAIEVVLTQDRPQTVRHVFYRLASHPYNLVPKTDDSKGYGTVARKLREMRRGGRIPYEWISDGTRWARVGASYSNPAEGVATLADYYRRDLWVELDV